MALRDGLRVEKSSGTLYWSAYWAGGQAYTGHVIEAGVEGLKQEAQDWSSGACSTAWTK